MSKEVTDSSIDGTVQTPSMENAEQKKNTSLLLRLPPELRDLVWKEVLGHRCIILSHTYLVNIWIHPLTADNLDLFLTSRQIYSESWCCLHHEFFSYEGDTFLDEGMRPIRMMSRAALQHVTQIHFYITGFFEEEEPPVDAAWLKNLPGLYFILFRLDYKWVRVDEDNMINRLRRFVEVYRNHLQKHDRSHPKIGLRLRLERPPERVRGVVSELAKEMGLKVEIEGNLIVRP